MAGLRFIGGRFPPPPPNRASPFDRAPCGGKDRDPAEPAPAVGRRIRSFGGNWRVFTSAGGNCLVLTSAGGNGRVLTSAGGNGRVLGSEPGGMERGLAADEDEEEDTADGFPFGRGRIFPLVADDEEDGVDFGDGTMGLGALGLVLGGVGLGRASEGAAFLTTFLGGYSWGFGLDGRAVRAEWSLLDEADEEGGLGFEEEFDELGADGLGGIDDELLLGRDVGGLYFLGSGYFGFEDEGVVGGFGVEEEAELNFGIRPLGSIVFRVSSPPNFGIRPRPTSLLGACWGRSRSCFLFSRSAIKA